MKGFTFKIHEESYKLKGKQYEYSRRIIIVIMVLKRGLPYDFLEIEDLCFMLCPNYNPMREN